MLDRWGDRFTHKLFTAGEREYALARPRPALHLAARFSAKEAMLKALNVPSGLRWHEMEVLGGGKQPPRLVLTGRAKTEADKLGVSRVFLSLTHTDDIASAVVVAES